jgi:hypothetical protein
MSIRVPSYTTNTAPPTPSAPAAEDEEFYSSWSLFLVCLLLILSLWTSYYLQIKRIRAVHETTVSIFAGMFVGLIIRLAPGTMIREMLVRETSLKNGPFTDLDVRPSSILYFSICFSRLSSLTLATNSSRLAPDPYHGPAHS